MSSLRTPLALLFLLTTGGSAAAAAPKPADVWWATADKGELIADVNQFAPSDAKAVAKLIEAFPLAGDRPYTEVPASDERLPKTFITGQVYTLVSEQGVHQLQLGGFGVAGDAAADRLFLRFGAPPAKVTRGLLLAPNVKVPATATLRPLDKKTGKAPSASQAKKVAAWLMKKGLDDEAKKKLDGAITGDQMLTYDVALPGRGKSTLIAWSSDLPNMMQGSALLLLDAKGKVQVVAKASVGRGHIEPSFAVDLDGKGIDALIVEGTYHEGYELSVLRWNGKAWVNTMVTGNGA